MLAKNINVEKRVTLLIVLWLLDKVIMLIMFLVFKT